MREIKFRAWTGSKLEYDIVVGRLGAFYGAGLDPKDSASFTPFNTIYSEQTPIMQYTGMKDRNDVEIYEGDIVAQRAFAITKSDGTPDKRYRQDEWYYKRAVAFGHHDGNASGHDYDDPGFYGWNIDPDELPSLEVLGNVYENSELLDEADRLYKEVL